MIKAQHLNLLFCLISVVLFAQQPDGKTHKFSLSFQTGLVSTYMNLDKHYKWYHEICCQGYDDDDLDSAPTFANYTNLSLNYHFNRKHQVGVGFAFSQMGENHDLGDNKPELLNYLGATVSYEYTFLAREHVSLGICNAFVFDMPTYNDKGRHFLPGISHIGGLVWRFNLNGRWGLSVNGILKNALTQYNAIAWYYDNYRHGYGVLLGLYYKI